MGPQMGPHELSCSHQPVTSLEQTQITPGGGKKEERLGSLCGTFKAWSPVTDGPLDLKQFLRAQILPRPPLQSERVSEPRLGPPPPSVYTAGNYCTRAELLHLNLLGRLSW